MTGAQAITKEVYEDPRVVRAFQEAGGKSAGRLEAFARSLLGKRLIDIGCGPGVDACRFAALGLEVTAVDYSEAMIQAAQATSTAAANPPRFAVLDMRYVGQAFPENAFDGAWVCASLLHIPEPDVPVVLAGLHRILTPGGRAHISLKGGPQGAALVTEHKHGREIQREFVFWEREAFEARLILAGFRVVGYETGVKGTTGGQPTQWLQFTVEAEKPP